MHSSSGSIGSCGVSPKGGGGQVMIKDWDGLQKAGEFDPTYLHLKKKAA